MMSFSSSFVRNSLQRLLPAHFHDPFGLFFRLVRTRDPAALFTIGTSLLAAVALPLDLLLQIVEKRLYERAPLPSVPLIFVTGPARSGTTLVAQVLIEHLPVTYFNNLTAVFQRSPILANILFGRLIRSKSISHKNYYGKTVSFSGPNDALQIWDRWVGKDRTRIPSSISETQKRDMVRFFGAWERAFRRPLVNKNNNLSTFPDLVAYTLQHSHFICLTRNPLYLAQSLLKARIEIHGDINVPYGIYDPRKPEERERSTDFVQDVCEQVLFHEREIKKQEKKVGRERFWVVPYEDFCQKPEALVTRVSEKILKQPVNIEELRKTLKPFKSANTLKLDHNLFMRIQHTMERLRSHAPSSLKKLAL
jgi:hypothetical protein